GHPGTNRTRRHRRSHPRLHHGAPRRLRHAGGRSRQQFLGGPASAAGAGARAAARSADFAARRRHGGGRRHHRARARRRHRERHPRPHHHRGGAPPSPARARRRGPGAARRPARARQDARGAAPHGPRLPGRGAARRSLLRRGGGSMSASLPPAPSAGATLRRLWAFTRPHARRRNALLLLVLVRACQLPALAWATAALISGPVTRADLGRLVLGCAGLLGLVLATEAVFVFRMRLALELGEAVVHDLRNSLWSRLMEMPLEFYDRWERGHLISRMTADCEAVRVGVQDVLFVGVVQLGVMLVTAGLMLAQDWLLFLVVVAIVPVLWGLLRRFHSRIARATREVQQSFSRVTASLAENVTGIREIQGFSRQRINGGLFRELIYD